MPRVSFMIFVMFNHYYRNGEHRKDVAPRSLTILALMLYEACLFLIIAGLIAKFAGFSILEAISFDRTSPIIGKLNAAIIGLLLYPVNHWHFVKNKGFDKQINTIDSAVLNYRKSFIRQEIPSYFTMQELYFLRNDLGKDSLKYLFNRFPEQLRLTNQGSVIYQYINNVKPVLGSKFIDIEAENLAGKKVKISDFNGKYVLLDFWASWCAPCRQENPEFVKVYEEFKNKGFEIYGYSTDVNRASWAKAIASDNLPWVNVSDLKGFYSEGPARYQVRAIPQNFLIDKKGFIIARNIKSEGLRVKLRELFKELW